MINTKENKIKAYLAGVNLNDPNFDYYMTELGELSRANQMEVVGQNSQKADKLAA